MDTLKHTELSGQWNIFFMKYQPDTREFQIEPKAGLHRGFSLVELMVVMSVIAILAALFLGALSKVKQRGREMVCVNNSRQIGLGFMMYLNESEDAFPAANSYNQLAREDWIYWQPFYRQPFVIPSSERPVDQTPPAESPIARYLGGFNTNLFICPSNEFLKGFSPETQDRRQRFPFSYTLSNGRSRIGDRRKFGMASEISPSPWDTPRLFRHSSIKRPSGKIMLAEERTMNEDPASRHGWDSASSAWKWHDGDKITQIHSGKGHVVFADNHVEKIHSHVAESPEHADPLF
jgi:prepilin-type N-terminal cleavage/methylation domain-containing protein/prepilin-type processing-associated H-X9-DG protein